ncbi:hypothetical protein B0H13DRAFT_2669187 [Mycena leptocephala]|nr:hypothetical protein B0H13DRAFT_2669187 [Mycena leptocephala]
MPSLFSRARTASTPPNQNTSAPAHPLYKPPPRILQRAPPPCEGEQGEQAPREKRGTAPSDSYRPPCPSTHVRPGPPHPLRLLWRSRPLRLRPKTPPISYLEDRSSPARDPVLGLADAARLVGTICTELERTGVATPFVFSALALDMRRAGVVRLVDALLATFGLICELKLI